VSTTGDLLFKLLAQTLSVMNQLGGSPWVSFDLEQSTFVAPIGVGDDEREAS
jgi:hypothetical protein